MKIYFILILAFFFSSCSGDIKTSSGKREVKEQNLIIKPEFQSIIDSAEVSG